MRRIRARYVTSILCLLAWPAQGMAAISMHWVPITITPQAIKNDFQLANMQTFEVRVTTDGDWTSAGIQATLPAGFNFYNHPFGGNTRPNPALVAAFPALDYDTYVTGPGDTGSSGAPVILGGFPDPEPLSMSGNRLSVAWGNLVSDPPGTYPILRMTFPLGVLPILHPESATSQTNPDSTAPLDPWGPIPNQWLPDADGSWHVGANWSRGQPPNGNELVTIDVGGPAVRTITHSSGFTDVNTLSSQEHILLTGGSLNTAVSTIFIANGMTISGGTLMADVQGSPVTIGPAGGRVQSVAFRSGLIMPGGAPLLANEGLRLVGDASLSTGAVLQFEGSQSISSWSGSDTGILHFNDGGGVSVQGGTTLTIGSAITMRGSGGAIGQAFGGGASTVVNHGHIVADVAGGGMSVNPDLLFNRGRIEALAGSSVTLQPLLRAEAGAVGGDGVVRALNGLRVIGTMSKPGTGPLRANGEFSFQAAGSTLDLIDGSLINDYFTSQSPLEMIFERIQSGYNGGSWDGTGINSSTAAADGNFAVGYAEAADLFTSFPATFAGESIDDTTVLLLLTRTGDADLDGSVGLNDFNRLATSFGNFGFWSGGDFNFDLAVNLSDFNLLAANFGLSASPDGPTPDDWSALAAAVPEPGVGLVMLVMGALVVRRRRG